MIITAANNPQVKEVAKLINFKKIRDELGLTVVFGEKMIDLANNFNLVTKVFSLTPSAQAIGVSNAIVQTLVPHGSNFRSLAIIKKPLPKALGKKVVAIVDVQDAGNVGTLIRTAKAFNYDTVLCCAGADPFSPKSLLGGSGAHFEINIVQTESYAEFLQMLSGHALYATLAHANETVPYDSFTPQIPFAIAFGNEGHGLKQIVIDAATKRLHIPTAFASLNVAIAGGIILAELAKKVQMV